MWITKEMKISILTATEVQIDAYKKFVEEFKNPILALQHTNIFMQYIATVGKNNPNNQKQDENEE